ncbi:MAG: malonyl CoA-acyl carrier protein transacylase [Candidatus Saccharibacteria bacterium]|nr:malonyl CoA-acyl carrier protein transacylase [Candidatus Saccharibacteria bacterium]
MRKVKVAFMAPGQGVTSWEEGLSLLDESPRTERIYKEVYDATGVKITDVCEGKLPQDDTSIVQPAALGIGYARAEVLNQERGIKPDYLIGVSSGEFTVTAISRAISLKDAARFAQERGRMQQELAGGLGSAVSVLHRKELRLDEILKGLEGRAYPSNFHVRKKPNETGMRITGISYLHEVYDELRQRLEETGAKVIDIKNLEFPPHGDHLKGVQESLAKMIRSRTNLTGIKISDADTPIIATMTARAMQKARTIRRNIVWQTTNPTQLSDSVDLAVTKGVTEFYDLGPGDSMSKLLGFMSLGDNVKIIPVSISQ